MVVQNSNRTMVQKANGETEIFDPEKLRMSLINSGATEEMSANVLSRILPELRDGLTTGEIYKRAFSVLGETDKPAARSYSLRRAIMDLGPSGFSFEDFVAEILRSKGFQCQTRQNVLGGCVPHEVDVVAYDDKRLIMVEAKFHNELGTKSDLKVALYIKARFDDIKNNVFDYGGEDRKVTDSWLITNTKFSSTAVHYAECQKMTLIGWNYPAKGNLQDMIEEERLHPVTCLTSLTEMDKRTLLLAGVVLCSNIKRDPSVLSKYLGTDAKTEAVLAEINEL